MCSSGSYFDASKALCIELPKCSVGATYNNTLQQCVCPADKPHDDGFQCLNCDKPGFWNETAKHCALCPSELVYNELTKDCEKCPAENPLEKGGECVPCPDKSYFHSDSKLCIECPVNTFFNTTTETCVSLPSLKPFVCPYNKILNSLNFCQCPIETPHDTGFQCVRCENTFWNASSKAC